MFVRVKRSDSGGRPVEYLQIVESVRHGGKVRQRLIANLGRRDELVASGALDALTRSLAKFSERVRVVDKVRSDGIQAHDARSWGPALVFRRLWEQQGLPSLLEEFADGRRFGFDVERTCFALALQRLCAPGSDFGGHGWLRTVECPGFAAIELHHLYRTVANFLCPIREELERKLLLAGRDLFSQLDLLFIDTTSTMVWRSDETELRRRGYSRDHRPDQPQVVLCVAVDAQGWPVAWDILPGNTADRTAFVQMIDRLRGRLQIRQAIIVADRGMISRETIALLVDSKIPYQYILGCRMRRQKEVSEEVLARAGRYHRVAGKDNLEVKEVRVDGRRYIVCRNPDEARKDALAREALVARLEQTLAASGPKALVGNKGYKRFLSVAAGAASIDRQAVERDARLDGKFVLRTNTDFTPSQVALAYKSLWRVERAFRETKSTLEVRPLYHRSDDASIGHIVACFLALRLEVDLQRRLDERAVDVSWPDLMRDLGEVRAVDVTLDDTRYRLRTDLVGAAHHAFAAAGVRPPPIVTTLGDAPAAAPM